MSFLRSAPVLKMAAVLSVSSWGWIETQGQHHTCVPLVLLSDVFLKNTLRFLFRRILYSRGGPC